MPPTVSINLCCYNSEKYLRETLDSIIAQTFKDWELIIINDGSNDSTESIIDGYMKQGYPIVYYCQENKGLGYSRNRAIERSSGEYVAIIDHDDLLHRDSIQERVNALSSHASASFVFTNARFLRNGKLRGQFHRFDRKFAPEISLREFIRFPSIAVSSVLIRRSSISEMSEWFDEKLSMIEDLDFWIRMAVGKRICFIDKVLSYWRVHENNATKVNYDQFSAELSYLMKKYSQNYGEEIDFVLVRLKQMQVKYDITGDLLHRRRREAFKQTLLLEKTSLTFFYYVLLCFLPYRAYVFIQTLRGRY
jgi:glycosyltransferase involved in cell wall biosynthesis